jgi:hypothetical protein
MLLQMCVRESAGSSVGALLCPGLFETRMEQEKELGPPGTVSFAAFLLERASLTCFLRHSCGCGCGCSGLQLEGRGAGRQGVCRRGIGAEGLSATELSVAVVLMEAAGVWVTEGRGARGEETGTEAPLGSGGAVGEGRGSSSGCAEERGASKADEVWRGGIEGSPGLLRGDSLADGAGPGSPWRVRA